MKDIFLKEILSQPRALRTILDRYLGDEDLLRSVSVAARQKTHDLILLTGMGTSYFALYPACIYLNERGVPAVMLETSELLHYYRGLISDRVLVMLVSQSGETIEAKRLFDEIGDGPLVIGITNNAESHVARSSDLPIFLHAGQEDGPASKSYTASLVVLLLCAMSLTASLDTQKTRRLYEVVGAMEDWLDQWEGCIDRLAGFLGKANHLSLLGRGPSIASTAAGSLILKEVAKVQAEAMSGGQFRHGPLEIASPGFAAFIFAPSGKTRDLNLQLVRDIAGFGGKVVLVGNGAGLEQEGIFNLSLPAIEELYAPLVEIVPLQLLARQMALDKGLQPGKFDKAGKVTLVE